MGATMKQDEYGNDILARWESRSGKHWVNLDRGESGYGYRSNGSGGSLGLRAEWVASEEAKGRVFDFAPNVISEADALAQMEAKVLRGYFLPDAAKTAMVRKF